MISLDSKRCLSFFCFAAFFCLSSSILFCEEESIKTNSAKQIRLYSSSEESAGYFRNKNGLDSVVHGDESRFVHKKYDKNGRVIVEKIWKNDGGGYYLEEKSTYSYSSDSARVSKKQIYLLSDSKLIEQEYNKNGLVSAETAYSLDEKGKKISKPLYSYSWKYDDKNRIVEESSRSEKGIKLKTIYTFTSNSFPDEKQYMSGELIYEKKYITSDDYEETVFFDDGTTVITVFESGEKKSETVKIDGRVVRTKTF